MADEPKFERKSFADLLTSTGPNTVFEVPDIVRGRTASGYWLSAPSLLLYCDDESCAGDRFFDGDYNHTQFVSEGIQTCSLTYKCRNCNRTQKRYALTVIVESSASPHFYVVKLGEWPPFGPRTPGRLISLIGPDRELFLKGRRAELQGLGIGAFSYYRRVVENQKGRLIEEIASVAGKLGADDEVLRKFRRAQGETQFSRAIDNIRDVIPQSLLIERQNPLTLLHSALSEGLHARSDEECLELATSIRVLLTELAERIGQALKDQAELKGAVTRLLNPPSDASAKSNS